MSWYKIVKAEAALGVKDDAKSSDKIILRQAIIAELDAINLYEQFAASTDNEHIKEVMLSVAKEEKIHVGEFETLLKEVDSEEEVSLDDGEDEVDDMEELDDDGMYDESEVKVGDSE